MIGDMKTMTITMLMMINTTTTGTKLRMPENFLREEHIIIILDESTQLWLLNQQDVFCLGLRSYMLVYSYDETQQGTLHSR